MKCAIENCENYDHQGLFVGALCAPCYKYLSTGSGKDSQAYRNHQERLKLIPDYQPSFSDSLDHETRLKLNMNYTVVMDEDILNDFIEWLPKLEKHETYYICLFARSKYCSNKEVLASDKQQIKRFTSNKRYMVEKLKKLECALNTFKNGDVPIPQEALSTYITVNPRSLVKATAKSIQNFSKLLTEPYNGYNPHQEVLSAIQTSNSKTHYMDFDFDHIEIDEIRPKLDGIINESAVKFLKTRGGFHMLIDITKVEPKYKKSWYLKITGLPGCDVRGDNLIPIPGTYQGGFVPYFLK